VVTNVLDFTRKERGAPRAAAARGDLKQTIEEGVAMVRPVLEGAGLKLTVEFAEEIPPALFDADAVFHILQNLLDNAEKFTRSTPERSVRVTLKPGRRGVELTVADNGPGIPPEERLRLFKPFARGSNPSLPAGIGLGLAMVKALAEAQGAQVACEDALGHSGAAFKVIFKSA
jgi:two-component system sensor histidine kinase KdpD